MASDFGKAVKKTLDITIRVSRLTSEVLKAALNDVLNNKAVKNGKVSMRQLISQSTSGKLESIEITDNNIKDFLDTARKYNIDFSLKRDKGTEPPTYHVFFAAEKTESFKRAFSEYASIKQNEITRPQRGELSRDQLKQHAHEISQRQAKDKNRVRQRTNEVSR